MKVLYKCIWELWGYIETEPCLSYYLEIPEKEFTSELENLLIAEKEQIKRQLREFNNIYIIIDKDLKYAMCIPGSFGPHWPACGMWNIPDKFYDMNGVRIIKLIDLKYLEEELSEFRKIIINEFPYGPDTTERLELYNIKITLSNYSKRKAQYFGSEYYKKYNIEIKSKIFKKSLGEIDEIFFNNVFKRLYSLDFNKLYSENEAGCDGSGFKLEIITEKRLSKNMKKVELWTPAAFRNDQETKKLLKIIDAIKITTNYESYIEILNKSEQMDKMEKQNGS